LIYKQNYINITIDIFFVEKILELLNVVFWAVGILVVVISLLIVLKFRKAMTKRYRYLNSIPSKIYTSKHGDIEYFLTGEGPTILVSHGITGGVDQGISLSKDYIGDGYRLLFVSRFGYLKSSIPNGASSELQVEVYKELLDYLGIRKIFIFGNSAGGTSAIQFAIKYPKRCSGLILLSSNAPLDALSGHPPKFVFKSNLLYWFVTKIFGKSMLGMFVPKNILKNLSKQEIKNIIDGLYFSALPITKRTKGILFDLFVSNPSINDKLPFDVISSPVLIINSIDDQPTLIEGAKKLANRIKTSKLLTFETGGHLILGHEEEISQNIKEFISNHY
jgi:pimeloyl-ACP methyl ester carboxylesterase